MAANTSPISPIAPATSWSAAIVLTGNTATTGLGTDGTDINLFFTAGANGARIGRIRVMHRGTNIATVIRFFINNGSANSTATNNILTSEITMAANTISQVAASVFQDVYLNVVLKPGYKLMATNGTTVASGFAYSAVDAGDY